MSIAATSVTAGRSEGQVYEGQTNRRRGTSNTRVDQVYGSSGTLEVKLAGRRRDIRKSQRLRYRVFFEEMAAEPSMTAKIRRIDEDAYDAVCDHLLVMDKAGIDERNKPLPLPGSQRPRVVGSYRVLRQQVAVGAGLPFYTQGEYDIAPMIAGKGPATCFMELGRSCVDKPYRNKRTIELLWHGLWTYVRQHKIDVLVGCASFAGTDPEVHAMALSFLHHNAAAPPQWLASAHPHLYQPMDLIAKDQLDAKAALKAMPPLIKAYLRLGAYFGDGAVIDRQFGTTDVLVILPVSRIDPKYFAHFGAPEETTSRIAGG